MLPTQPTQAGATISLLVSNMHCPSCCEAIKQILNHLPCVKDLSINLLQRTITFAVESHGGHKTASIILNEVVGLLEGEGGFVIDKPGSSLPAVRATLPLSFSDIRNSLSWGAIDRTRQFERGDDAKRRERHLMRCEACRQELEPKASVGSPSHRPLDRHSAESPSILSTLSIGGMTCASCTQSISSTLKVQPDILEVTVNLLSASALVRHRPSLPAATIAELVEDTGFECSVVSSAVDRPPTCPKDRAGTTEVLMRTTFMIEDMTCGSSSSTTEATISTYRGVKSVTIDISGNTAAVVHDTDVSPAGLREAVKQAGYGAKVTKSEKVSPCSEACHFEPDKHRTINIAVRGIFCPNCVDKINTHLATMDLISYSPISMTRQSTTIAYAPRRPYVIRDILQSLSDLAPEFQSEVVKTKTLSDRSQEIQHKEFVKLASHLTVAVLFAIPTFTIGIVGMVLLPRHNAFRMICMQPIWGAATLGTVVLWPLATVIQFGVGRLFYERAFHSMWPHLRPLVPSFLFSPSSRRTLVTHPLWYSFFSFGSMDLLVSLSTSVSYFASLAMLIIDVRSPQSESVGTYFDSCVFLIMFILLGRTLEAYAKSRTTDAVSLLGSLRPATAFLVDEQSWNLHEKALSSPDLVVHDIGTSSPPYPTAPREVPVEQLEKGDLVLIPPGALPPTDGVIVSGSTTFDEASLTGESMPVPKTVGDEVFTGTNNLSGAVTIRVIKLGGETMLSKIIAAVSDASAKKAPIEKLAERLTGVFVPVIVYLSIIILAIWLGVVLSDHVNVANRNGGEVFFAIEFAISVLVVACPCGIGLAVPCANAVGNGIAARAGILAAGGGEAFLAATRVTTVAFDKTGTLTVGKSVMTAEKYLPDSSDSSRVENVKAVVQAVEIGSTHPLAKGLAECLAESTSRTMPVEVLSSNEVSGRGLIAKVKVADNSLDVLIGNLSLMHQHAVHVPPAMLDLLKTWSNQAKSVVLVALRREDESPFNLRAMYALSDRPRAEAADVIGQLKAKGIRVVMLSGDNGRTANAVAGIVGIRQEDVWADVGPQGKATVIRELQARPRAGRLPPSLVERARRSFGGRPKDIKEVVMFIGDGLNDSVALAAADASVAMGHGSQSTLASASFVLLSSSLSSLPALLHISRKVRSRQILNLGWALAFNIICIPFAAGAFYPAGGIRLTPVWSAVLMALSSVSVVMSSLALRWGL